MNCQEIQTELVSYAEGELGDELHAEIQDHLSSCETCCKELKDVEQTLSALRTELVPIELSAHFRLALADRLDEATEPTPSTPELNAAKSRGSERHIADMDKKPVIRLMEHAKRSPYFALSLLAHAAAVLIIISFLVKGPVEPVANPDNDTIAQPERPAIQLTQSMTAYQQRCLARRVPVNGTKTQQGVEITLAALLMDDQSLALVGDKELNCVRAYFVREDDAKEESIAATLRKDKETGELLDKNPGIALCQIDKAKLVVPTTLAARHFGDSTELFVFELRDRLEIWSRPTWNSLKKECTEPAVALRGTGPVYHAQAILPRRRDC